MICPNCKNPHLRQGRRPGNMPKPKLVEMICQGEVPHARGIDMKWQCPECRATHFVEKEANPITLNPLARPARPFVWARREPAATAPLP